MSTQGWAWGPAGASVIRALNSDCWVGFGCCGEQAAHLCCGVWVCMGGSHNHRRPSAWGEWGPDRRGLILNGGSRRSPEEGPSQRDLGDLWMTRRGGRPAEALALGQDGSRLPGDFSPCLWASMFLTVQWGGFVSAPTARVLRNKPLGMGGKPLINIYTAPGSLSGFMA